MGLAVFQAEHIDVSCFTDILTDSDTVIGVISQSQADNGRHDLYRWWRGSRLEP